MPILTINENIEQLHFALLEYIEAVYHISNIELVRQRNRLLLTPGVIHQAAFLESTPRYKSGDRFSSIEGLPKSVLKLLESLANERGPDSRLIYDPPYKHQLQAVEGVLVSDKNLMVMTGTGSGKTESFLLPIIGKLVNEASNNPSSFKSTSAVRAMILYPMNALVNDQLGRVRNFFRDERLQETFRGLSGRIPTFARYTSRTPYPGVRSIQKDQTRLKAFEEFYVNIEEAAGGSDPENRNAALKLMSDLKRKGKWPAKPEISKWYGSKKMRWQDNMGNFQRAVTLANDAELVTRQEVQMAPPDLLITNYSMLEYMLMRPIERPIFEKTLTWLKANPKEKFLIVIDEAHLYRGAAGAEVGLLLRRLRERLELPAERLSVICATASFDNKDYSLDFASQLSGVDKSSFISIVGDLSFKEAKSCSETDVRVLSEIDLDGFYSQIGENRNSYVYPFLKYRGVDLEGSLELSLFRALKDFGPLNKLINITMGKATPIDEIGKEIFNSNTGGENKALSVLLALSSIARESENEAALLPCRIHSFFRGVPGLWVCINPNCSLLRDDERSSICGKLFSQPRQNCDCGGRVFELYTCRNCGTAYARAYTDDVESPSSLWTEPGANINLSSSQIKDFYPVDLLLEEPTDRSSVQLAYLDIVTGRLNPENLGENCRTVYIKNDRIGLPAELEEDDLEENGESSLGRFTKCPVCRGKGGGRDSAVQDHQTKGDQPFLALLSRQIQVQPPGSMPATRFAPLRGRKVLIFSDSRQTAAKLSPNLQTYSLRDALRPLLIWGFKSLIENRHLTQSISLDDSYLAVLIAANHFGIQLRPELKASDNFYSINQQVQKEIEAGILNDGRRFSQFFNKFRTQKAPESLLNLIVSTICDAHTGIESLALATVSVQKDLYDTISSLPAIATLADSDESKIALANYWVRCWNRRGHWLKDMPDTWWKPSEPKSKESVIGHKSGEFNRMKKLLSAYNGVPIFKKHWLPQLIQLADNIDGLYRLSGNNLTLNFDGAWVRCKTCSSVHRPIPGIIRCLDCDSINVATLNPTTDIVFCARKGYYRRGVQDIFLEPAVLPVALVAAEHTAQLNAPQSDDVFSKAEENELLFQDINISWPLGQGNNNAIDILSSTTTMEVGIDIGALSGVALRNMPPSRANYQQRSGRAGRRGNAVASVVAFGSVDSHDEHYFSHPKEMISGPVIDPIITLNNPDIVRRHIRAFLIQKYHQEKLPEYLPAKHSANLFSVLGTVKEFIRGSGSLNRDDFRTWLANNEAYLKARIASWIPSQLTSGDRMALIENAIADCLTAVDDATDFKGKTNNDQIAPEPSEMLDVDQTEPNEEEDLERANLTDGLLDRLLYRGKLPRYAFPTDVATFHVFDQNKSTSYRPVMKFAPSQGLPIALTQYAPDKQVWISNKCYTSGAIYSPIRGENFEAWEKRKLYYECSNCGYAKTEGNNFERRGEISQCEACGEPFPEPFSWVRPPGFAHPIDVPEQTTPDGMPEVGYATRAKLHMSYPDAKDWMIINDRISGLKLSPHLLVSNTGPNKEGYIYCRKCGRIEAKGTYSGKFSQQHKKPYPAEDPLCEGGLTAKIVLGTDFITDVGLFSIDLRPKIRLIPGSYTYHVALRTLSEALSKAAAQLLEIEPNDVVAEYRPALTGDSRGKNGEQVEIFLYDTLPGGAGFASQLVDRGEDLFRLALQLMESCKECCDSSCYRCLRSFKNKREHVLLDRHVGIELIKFILTGQMPSFHKNRIQRSRRLLFEDLVRHTTDEINYSLGFLNKESDSQSIILATKKDRTKYAIAICGPLTPEMPIDDEAYKIYSRQNQSDIKIIPVDEFLIRNSLPSATKYVLEIIA